MPINAIPRTLNVIISDKDVCRYINNYFRGIENLETERYIKISSNFINRNSLNIIQYS